MEYTKEYKDHTRKTICERYSNSNNIKIHTHFIDENHSKPST